MRHSSWDLCSLARIEPGPLAVTQSLNPWPTREFPGMHSSPLNGNSFSTLYFLTWTSFEEFRPVYLLVFLYQTCVVFPPAILSLCFWREHCRSGGESQGVWSGDTLCWFAPYWVMLASITWLKWGPLGFSTVNSLTLCPFVFHKNFLERSHWDCVKSILLFKFS